jgi:hypothetical protein
LEYLSKYAKQQEIRAFVATYYALTLESDMKLALIPYFSIIPLVKLLLPCGANR